MPEVAEAWVAVLLTVAVLNLLTTSAVFFFLFPFPTMTKTGRERARVRETQSTRDMREKSE